MPQVKKTQFSPDNLFKVVHIFQYVPFVSFVRYVSYPIENNGKIKRESFSVEGPLLACQWMTLNKWQKGHRKME